jgi:uncharacterized protein YlxW (UPF0749 family)
LSDAPARRTDEDRDAEIAALRAKLEECEDEVNKLWSAIRRLSERADEMPRGRW